jgi:hypothetical protein
MWKNAMDSGSPPCSPHTPSLGSCRASRPTYAARRTSQPTPGWSIVSNGERSTVRCCRCFERTARLDVVAGEAERGLGEIVGAGREEVRRARDVIGDEAGAGELDHRADQRAEDFGAVVGDDLLDALAQDLDLLLVGDERDHDLHARRLAQAALDGAGGGRDGFDLDVVDLGRDMARITACILGRKSPDGSGAPVTSSRLKATPSRTSRPCCRTPSAGR